jgi:ABC transporter substrate binding protein
VSATSERAGALVVPAAMCNTYRGQIVDFAAKNRLPAMYGEREAVELGGLMSYGPSLPDLYRRAATYVEKILKRTKPADLPVEQPTKFKLVINLKTARALGPTIPFVVLMRAEKGDQVRKHNGRTRQKTLEELLVASLAQADALAKLLMAKGVITREELMARFRRNGRRIGSC